MTHSFFAKFTQTQGDIVFDVDFQAFETGFKRLATSVGGPYTGEVGSGAFSIRDAKESVLRIEGRYAAESGGRVRVRYEIKPEPKIFKMTQLIVAVWLVAVIGMAFLGMFNPIFAALMALMAPAFLVLPFYARLKPAEADFKNRLITLI